MPIVAVYSWDQFTLPSGIPTADLEGDTHANDPAHVDYSPSATTWIGETFTFDGGAPTQIDITDDDAFFEDGYVETGAPQTLTSDLTIGGTTYPAGSVIQNEFSMVDGSGNEVWVVAINGVNIGFTYPASNNPAPGETFTAVNGRDGDPADSGDGVASNEAYSGVICFATGTQIATPAGLCQVEKLQSGDCVLTYDSGTQEVVWTSRRKISFSGRAHSNQPVLIPAGSLGEGVPRHDLKVSPQHRLLVVGEAVQQVFGKPEVLVPAKGLIGLKGIRKMNGIKDVTYVHLLFEQHHIITANGAPAESFYPGKQALFSISEDALRSVLELFPGVAGDPIRAYGHTARICATVKQTRKMVDWVKCLPSEKRNLVAANTISRINSHELVASQSA